MKKSSLNRMIRLCGLQSKRRQDGEKKSKQGSRRKFCGAAVFALIMSTLLLGFLAACESENNVQNQNETKNASDKTEKAAKTTDPDNIVSGGWSRGEPAEITDDIKAVFKKASEGDKNAEYTPVAYVSSQIVAGKNHMVLCKAIPRGDNADVTYALVTVYEDPDGNAEITQVLGSTVKADYPGGLAGGWSEASSPELTPEAKDALEKAAENVADAQYRPIAFLGDQVVAGKNYLLLCEITTTAQKPVSRYSLVYVYEDLNGNAEITDTIYF